MDFQNASPNPTMDSMNSSIATNPVAERPAGEAPRSGDVSIARPHKRAKRLFVNHAGNCSRSAKACTGTLTKQKGFRFEWDEPERLGSARAPACRRRRPRRRLRTVRAKRHAPLLDMMLVPEAHWQRSRSACTERGRSARIVRTVEHTAWNQSPFPITNHHPSPSRPVKAGQAPVMIVRAVEHAAWNTNHHLPITNHHSSPSRPVKAGQAPVNDCGSVEHTA